MRVLRLNANSCERDEGDGTIVEDVRDVARRVDRLSKMVRHTARGSSPKVAMVHNLGGLVSRHADDLRAVAIKNLLEFDSGRSSATIKAVQAKDDSGTEHAAYESAAVFTDLLIKSHSRGLYIEGVTTGGPDERASFGALIADVCIPLDTRYAPAGGVALEHPDQGGFSKGDSSEEVPEWANRSTVRPEADRGSKPDRFAAIKQMDQAVVTFVIIDAPLSKSPESNIVQKGDQPPHVLTPHEVQRFWEEVDRKMASSLYDGADVVMSISSDEKRVLDRLPTTALLLDSGALVNIGEDKIGSELVVASHGINPERSVAFTDRNGKLTLGCQVSSPLWIENTSADRLAASEAELAKFGLGGSRTRRPEADGEIELRVQGGELDL